MKIQHANTINSIYALLRRISHLMSQSLLSEARGLTYIIDERLSELPDGLADWLVFNKVFPAYERVGINHRQKKNRPVKWTVVTLKKGETK